MAIYNEILVARYARMLQKLFGVKGSVPTKQLAGEIMAVFAIFAGNENRYLEGWEIFGATFLLAAGGVGNFGKMRIRNPVGSNVIAVTVRATFSNSAIDTPQLSLGPQTADLGTLSASATTRADARGRAKGTLIISAESNTVGQTFPGLGYVVNTLAGSHGDFILGSSTELPILPGDALQIAANAPNQAVNIAMMWRERTLEESERA